ncbi:hypothetical protein VRK_30660 [Vibrio sp. MEBiC08052]|nr:hypothetical protein VRK_30660 [Vibrio sp. MEBiC08052]
MISEIYFYSRDSIHSIFNGFHQITLIKVSEWKWNIFNKIVNFQDKN